MVLAYVSAIQDISLSPVLMSGAGTSMPGPEIRAEQFFIKNWQQNWTFKMVIQKLWDNKLRINTRQNSCNVCAACDHNFNTSRQAVSLMYILINKIKPIHFYFHLHLTAYKREGHEYKGSYYC